MALIFSEGFDAYGTSGAASGMETRGWLNNGEVLAGRTDGYALGMFHNQSNKIYMPGTATTKTLGFALWINQNLPDLFHVYMMDGTTVQIKLIIGSSNTLEFYRGTTLLATGTTTINHSTWYYIEIQSTINNTVGAYEVMVNGVSEVSATGLDTQVSTNTYWGALQFSLSLSANNAAVIDDLYILDDTGSYNNDFIGPMHIETLFPDADGGTNQWTPSTGTDHYALVDDNPADDDTTYLSDDTTGQRELFDLPALSSSPVIAAVVPIQQMRVSDVEPLGIKHVNVSGVTTTVGSEVPVCSVDWARYADISEENPNTSAAWTKTTLDAAQFGFEVS